MLAFEHFGSTGCQFQYFFFGRRDTSNLKEVSSLFYGDPAWVSRGVPIMAYGQILSQLAPYNNARHR